MQNDEIETRPEDTAQMQSVTPVFEAAEPDAIHAHAAPIKGGVGLPTVLLCSLLAAVLGAGGGGMLAYHWRVAPADMPETGLTEADLAPLAAELEALRKMQQAQSREFSDFAQSVGTLPAVSTDLSDVRARLSELETAVVTAKASDMTELLARLETLENAAPPEIDADALAQLRAAQADGFEWPDTDTLRAEITSLRSQIQALEARPVYDPVQVEGAIAAATADLPTSLPPPEAPSDPGPEVVLLPFPKDALLIAARRVENEGKSFLQRRLSKHVNVREAGSPAAKIDEIEAALARDDLDAAGRLFDTLPSQIRTVAADWRAALETAK